MHPAAQQPSPLYSHVPLYLFTSVDGDVTAGMARPLGSQGRDTDGECVLAPVTESL